MGWNKGKGKTYRWLADRVNHDEEDCLIWPFCRNPNGYGQFGHLGVHHYAHRFMCQLVHGEAPEGCEAAHSCGNGNIGCVHPKHLSWKTKTENRIDALEHGTGVRGRNGRKRLTDEQVAEIRSLKGTMRQVDIAAKFGITEPIIRAIFTWKIYNGTSKIDYWTAEQEAKLREAIALGYSFRQMAEFVGRSQSSVMMRTYRLGLKSGWQPDYKKSGPPTPGQII